MNKCYLFAGLVFASSDVLGMLVDTAFDLNINEKRCICEVNNETINPNKKRSITQKLAGEFFVKNNINMPDKNGNAPLHLAIVQAKNKVRNSVEDSENQRDSANQKDKNENVPSEIKSLIEQGADINQKNKDGDFPTKIAFMCDKQNIVKYLLEKGADINQQDRHGHTLLHLATLEDNEEMITYLVEHGAAVNQENNYGQIPLHFSTYRSSLREKEKEKIVMYLVEHGADTNKREKNGQTPLDIAKQKDNERVTAYLLKHRVNWKR